MHQSTPAAARKVVCPCCGGTRSGLFRGGHLGDCELSVKKRLRSRITDIGAELDKRQGSEPGTAERALYFGLLAAESDSTGADVLVSLMCDGEQMLADSAASADTGAACRPWSSPKISVSAARFAIYGWRATHFGFGGQSGSARWR